mmetsp:Transcript_31039/g.69793  ORF Transcript_31039/g.69793 Transcript_31039/m.69793 type:complete len:165 (-) Transcript_31039:55-549(-)
MAVAMALPLSIVANFRGAEGEQDNGKFCWKRTRPRRRGAGGGAPPGPDRPPGGARRPTKDRPAVHPAPGPPRAGATKPGTPAANGWRPPEIDTECEVRPKARAPRRVRERDDRPPLEDIVQGLAGRIANIKAELKARSFVQLNDGGTSNRERIREMMSEIRRDL